MTMTLTATPSSTTPDPTGPGAIWMLNTLMVERATTADTAGAYSILEQWTTADGNPPPHVHTHEDEAFLVVDGEIEVTVGDTTTVVPAGGFAFAPRGVPHTYAVREGTAHLLVIATPGGIEQFFRDLGEPAGALELPEPAAPDVGTVVTTAARHGITILPPPA
jgi:quercetin dioxygenase-like cupin family protein